MPKSKRAQIVSLTKTQKKTREQKDTLFQQVRDACDSFTSVYVFSVENMRNTFLKDLRTEWSTSKFFFGKNKVMAKALGTTAEEEYKEDLRYVAEKLDGNVGLLFTNASKEEVEAFFDSYRKQDYARSGCVATETFELKEGALFRGEDPFPHNMEPQLRSLGLPTKLVNGKVMLTRDHVVCHEGSVLTPEQAQLLKHFFVQMAEFHVTLLCHWNNGTFVDLAESS
ncbi:ribosomal protein L10-domain-containing protein [Polychytrium aggregatum]|uniref:ribosomal protein L10-domain-containing protein n=1 Tax=Polychytrium aggregatum TaxID=110093 RepID=UPI0022FDD9C8|nr:ribosomal protein L10-domain-containing protein [Polychytrium aggregatum]KAI9193147.1 ribosomal protein L10-domain-containing protein [Polychytrium aggregatum]